MKKPRLSASVITLNEEKNIGRLLKSLSFCDEIIVADTGSTDRTAAIAKQYGAKLHTIKFNGFSDAKNKALSFCTGDFVLSVDADEEIPAELARRIKAEINSGKAADGYRIKRNTFFLGSQIKHCGWGRDYQLRLIARKAGAFNGKTVHEAIDVKGSVSVMEEPMLHYSYPDSSSYFEKLNRYTSMQAKQKQKGMLILRMLTAPLIKFIRMYFFKLGMLDGMPGFILCAYSGFSEFIKFSKMLEEKKNELIKGDFALRAPNWLGDAIMSTVLIKPLAEKYSGIYVICPDKVKRVYEGLPGIKNIITFDKSSMSSQIKAVTEIKKASIKRAVTLSPSFSASLMLKLAGIKQTAGFDEDSLLLDIKLKRDKMHADGHITDEFMALCSLAEGSVDFSGAVQTLYVDPADEKNAKVKGRYAVIAPFSAYGAAKMWPVKNWEKLLQALLAADKKLSIVLLGTKADSSIDFITDKRIKDLRGKTGIGEAFALIKNAELFIGNDSGLMHAADALGTKMIVIFGSSSIKWTGPLQKGSVCISSDEPCSPCFEKDCHYGHYNCLKNIAPGYVVQAALRIISSRK